MKKQNKNQPFEVAPASLPSAGPEYPPLPATHPHVCVFAVATPLFGTFWTPFSAWLFAADHPESGLSITSLASLLCLPPPPSAWFRQPSWRLPQQHCIPHACTTPTFSESLCRRGTGIGRAWLAQGRCISGLEPSPALPCRMT